MASVEAGLESAGVEPPRSAAAPGLRVLRLCSVFEPPTSALGGRGARFDPVGGMQEHTGSLTRVLADRGLVQVVLTTRPPTAPWVDRPGPRTTVVRLGLPVRHLRQLYAAPAAVLAPVLGRRADIVHVHLGEDLAVLPLAALAAAPHRLPVVLTIHCSLAYTLQARDIRTAALRALGGRIERWAERHVDATIVYTSRLAGLLAEGGGARPVHVIRRGMDPRPYADPGPDPFPDIEGRARVVFLGRVVRAKGVETLVEAAARLRTRDVEVLLVGDGPDRSRVERLARRLGVADRVRVTGFVPHDRVPAVLASTDLLVLPSLYEELGAVLVEALHAGVPAIASRVGGIPEVVEDGVTGLLVPPNDPRALAAAIDAVLEDAGFARRLAANAKRKAVDYDLDHFGARVHDLYEQLAADWAIRHGVRPNAAVPARSVARFWPA
jgi:glycosyltransferase involved in cell wall biosynthesis